MGYLKGDKFSGSYIYCLTPTNHIADTTLIDRLTLLEELAFKKTVIHVGFVDHTLDQIHKKLPKNTWLHARLEKAASRCLGVDVNSPGVEYAKNVLGYNSITCADIISENITEIASKKWDVMLLGELIEHVNNPVWFLSELARIYRKNVSTVILSTPNAFKHKNFFLGLTGKEKINSDHRYWFTPFTIAKVLTQAGLSVKDIYMVSAGKLKPWTIKYFLQKRYFMLRDRLVVVAEFANDM